MRLYSNSGDSQRWRGEETMDKDLSRVELLAQQRLGRMLAEAGLVTLDQLRQAIAVQQEEGGDVVRILIALGFIDVDDLLEFLEKQSTESDPLLTEAEIDERLIAKLPADLAQRHHVVPVSSRSGVLLLAAAEPLNDAASDELEAAAGMPVHALLCAPADVASAVGRYYGGELSPKAANRAYRASVRLNLAAGLVRQLKTFPALPETVVRVREATQDPRSSLRDVARVIIMDPPIAAKVLSVANSAAYGFPRRVQEVPLAVTLLGLRETYSIVLSTAVLDLLEKTRHFDYKRFWLESMCCAAATRLVLKASSRRDLSGAFAAGLLHDIGRVALAEVAPSHYAQIPVEASDDDLIEEELNALGISHTEAGYELALHWDLPPELAQAIRHHHHPETAPEHSETAAAVRLADAMASAQGEDLEENKHILEKNRTSLDILRLDAEMAEAMLAEYLAHRDDALRDEMA
jgi:HD-like signal output (HDOD) protein